MRCSRLILWACAAAGMMLASCEAGRTRSVLDDVASYIEARPDSALAVLESVKPAEFGATDPSDSALVLRTRSGRARFSMLYSMALDKNYIDLTSDSIIAPAVAYYSRHGRPDDRLKGYYYRARIAENAGDLETALEWLVKGERFVPKCRDYSAVGRLYSEKATQYYNTYHNNEALENENLALQFYQLSGSQKGQISCKLNQTAILMCLKDVSAASDIVNSLLQNVPDMSYMQRRRFCRYNLSLVDLDSTGVRNRLELVYVYLSNPDDYPFLEMARAYNILECPDSSIFYLKKYRERDFPTISDPAYYTALSDAYVLQGDYYAAYDNERSFIYYEMNDLTRRMQSEINYVEEKTKTSYENKLARSRLFGWILLLSLLLLASSMTVYLIHKRLVENRRETERLNSLYESLLSEKEALEKIADGGRDIDERSKRLLDERIDKIGKVLLLVKSGNRFDKDRAMAKLNEIVDVPSWLQCP